MDLDSRVPESSRNPVQHRTVRAELLGHVQLIRYQYNLPAFPKKLANRTGRLGVGERFGDEVVRHNVGVDIEAIDYLEGAIKRLEAYLVRRTKVYDVLKHKSSSEFSPVDE